jgi:hypothetical protein
LRHKISVRKTEENEIISKECFMCDTDEGTYASHLSALIQDIAQINSVQNVSEIDNVITIDTPLDQKDIMDELKDLFSNEICYIRYVNIQ